ncbi:hypothetical protein WJX72_011332 [[Myrmecia] bisecta]|uniref:Thymocyte nuclear protein 1 n=1 Tax=[Myrmecia] bisecta TaxID=41462 RepID=A0AAW1PWW4_9CHLO
MAKKLLTKEAVTTAAEAVEPAATRKQPMRSARRAQPPAAGTVSEPAQDIKAAAAMSGAKRQKVFKPSKPAAASQEGGVPAGPRYFLLKSEPDVFGIDHLAASPDQTSHWDGVRNFQARNIMQTMRRGERCFFYHSSCKQPGIVGIVEVVREAYPDHTSWDPNSEYYDAKSIEDKPRWFMVDVKLVERLQRLISLEELKKHDAPELADMVLLNRGRLSVQPVTPAQWQLVLDLAKQTPDSEHGVAPTASRC